VGDWGDLQYRGRDVSGKVLDLSWRTVVLAVRADNLVLIPNGEFAGIDGPRGQRDPGSGQAHHGRDFRVQPGAGRAHRRTDLPGSMHETRSR